MQFLENYTKPLMTSLLTVMALAVAGCSGGDSTGSTLEDHNFAAEPAGEYELIWSDEFDGTSLDTDNWEIQLGNGSSEGLVDWGNNEEQYYTADNITLNDGNLEITARAGDSPDPGYGYTSGRIRTQGKLDITYGRVEASIQVPPGVGIWAAFWMLGSDPSVYGGWPGKGEIDIMESFSREEPFSQAALHYGMAFPQNQLVYKKYESVDPTDGFHQYAVEWDSEQVRWFIDGDHYFTVRADTYWNYYYKDRETGFVAGADDAPFNVNQHILLNMAVGGNLPGAPSDPSVFPAQMLVDYVRVYKCSNDPENTGLGCSGSIDKFKPVTVDEFDPASPYIGIFEIYSDGVSTLFEGTAEQTEFDISVDDNGGALTLAEVDLAGGGKAIEVSSTGGGSFSIVDLERGTFNVTGMGEAGDGRTYGGDFKFDINISSAGTDTNGVIQVRFDSGALDVGFVELDVDSIVLDEWVTVSVKVSDMLNGGLGALSGDPVNINALARLLTFEPSSAIHMQVNNIRLSCGAVDFCGIEVDAGPGVKTGSLIDSPVEGVNFETETQAGMTNAEGEFYYYEGEMVTFSLGGIMLGEVMGSEVITPVELTGSDEPTDAAATNMLVFLQSIDEDENPDNGITISAAALVQAASQTLDFESADFSTDIVTVVDSLTAGTNSVVTEREAQSHFYESYVEFGGTDKVEFEFPGFPLPPEVIVGGTGSEGATGGAQSISFDDGLITYSFTDVDGASTMLGIDPVEGANNVAVTEKFAGALATAATAVSAFDGAEIVYPLTTTASQISLRVYSPDAGTVVRMRVEDALDPTHVVEAEATTVSANQWQTLIFDFNLVAEGTAALNPAYTFDQLSVFFNYGVDAATAGDKTYYWDTLEFLGEGSGSGRSLPSLPVDYENNILAYVFTNEGGAVATVIDNPDASGINTSGSVASLQKFSGAVDAGNTINLAGDIDFNNGEGIAIKVWSQRSVDVTLSLDALGEEVVVSHTGSGWEELLFDFSGVTGLGVNTMSIVFDDGVLGNAGIDALSWTFYIDDITQQEIVIEPICSYSQDFESFVSTGSADVGDNFVIGNIVNGGAGWFPGLPPAGYFAPGDYNVGYSAIINEGGDEQGDNQLSIFSDYNPWSPFTAGAGTTIQAFVMRDLDTTFVADDIGKTYTFSFDAKLGNIDPALSQAEAFIKILDSLGGTFNELANVTFDSDANLTVDWSGGSIDVVVDAGMVGQLIQIGFNSTATDYSASGVVYDNLKFCTMP